MNAPTIKAQNDRIRQIMTAYPGYTAANDLSDADALTVLPAFVVAPNEGVRRSHTPRSYVVTRQFEIIGVVSVMSKIVSLPNRLAAYAVAEPIMEAWAAWLYQHPRLMLNNNALVISTGDISDGGFGPWTYGGVDYSAFRLQIPVTTRQP